MKGEIDMTGLRIVQSDDEVAGLLAQMHLADTAEDWGDHVSPDIDDDGNMIFVIGNEDDRGRYFKQRYASVN